MIAASDTPTPLTRAQLWTILSAAGCVAAVAAGFSFVGPVLSLLLERMTGSGTFIGTFATVGAITTVIFTPVAPKLLTRFAAPTLLSICCVLGALCFPLYYLIPDPVVWFAIRFAQGFFFTLCFVISETWINHTTPEAWRGRVLSLYAVCLAGGLGLGAAAAALLIQIVGLSGPLPFIVGLTISMLGVLPFLMRNQLPLPATSAENARLRTLSSIMRANPGLMATVFAFGAVEYSLFHLLPVYGVRLNFSESAAALLLLALPVGNIVLVYPIGVMADRYPRGKVLSGLFALSALLPLVAFAVQSSYVGIMLTFGLFIGTATGLYTLGLSILGERYKGDRMAAANAAFILSYGLGSLLAPILIGAAMDATGPTGLPAVMAGICALGMGVYLRFERRRGVDTATSGSM